MRIDAHQHFWKIDRGDYGWITPNLSRLHRDFLPADVEPILKKHGFDGCIVVQAAATLEETDYILSLSDQTESILGVVGWLDLSSKEHRKHFARYRLHPKFKGIRIMIQDMPDPTIILEPNFVDALREYAAEGFPIDLLLKHEQMQCALKLIQQIPTLRGVIDHLAKPPIHEGTQEPWARYLAEMSEYPGIYCKLSGMVTEAGQVWRRENFVPYVRKVVELFGPERVLFGSDWPVCLLAAEYDQVMLILLDALPEQWGDIERQRLFGLNAKEFYKL
ncbi:amidohydrolase family protein [Paenibacillus sp. ACRRY]|uniref:amidohydrolase family protein n=1 Tax=Paenibacillus sp. ACRRY TaxID=2918208 RepID=UPI001EF40F74|nr:amidohydrolase family protein [Paenibacillus sp. ACRRY]MCG7381746.1 amidohydrolase family protein [Paenibacillus sp. ACRRY]